MSGEFGFTNDRAELDAAHAWRVAAIADGWKAKPTYDKNEPLERHATLSKDGFVAHVKARDDTEKKYRHRYEAGVHVWAPDGLSVRAPTIYDFAAIKAGVRHCVNCGKDDVDTQRYSFAGRCCADCVQPLRAKYERSGWCD